MPTLVKIIAILIFVVVAAYITVNITKTVFKQVYNQILENQTKNLSQQQKDNLTADSIFKHFAGKNATVADKQQVTWAGHRFEMRIPGYTAIPNHRQ